MLLLLLGLTFFTFAFFFRGITTSISAGAPALGHFVLAILLALVVVLMISGFTTVQPNEAKALTFLGNMLVLSGTAAFGLPSR